MKLLDVVGAVIVRDGFVLCAKRGPSGALAGMWEFPGGKVEPGEDPRDALAREIREELACGARIGEEVTTTTHEYPFAEITLTTFWAELTNGAPTAGEHAELRWLAATDLDSVEWAPADLPAVHLVSERLSADAG